MIRCARLLTVLLSSLLALTSAAFANKSRSSGSRLPSVPSIQAHHILPIEFGAGLVPSVANLAVPGAAAVSLPAAVPPAPLAATPASALGSMQRISDSLGPRLELIGDARASDDGSADAAEAIALILQGGTPASYERAGGFVAAPFQSGLGGLRLAPYRSIPGPAATEPKAPEPQNEKVDSEKELERRRAGLVAIAERHGIVASLPQAGAALSARIIAKAAGRTAVLSDIDDTLAKYNTLLPQEAVDSIVAYRKAGKFFAAITDRPDKVKPGSSQLSAIDTFSSIPAADRAGIVLATNGGGKIYEYQADGEPKLIFEEPPLPESERPLIQAAADAVKAQLAAKGTALNEKGENSQPYGHVLILKPGTPEAVVKELAAIWQHEMESRGLGYEIEGRMAKDPKLPPYLVFSKLNKSVAVRSIATLKGLTAESTVELGDSMYAPKLPEKLDAAGKEQLALAETLSGQPLPLTGNATDRNMELGLPGAMALSVGGTADPRMKNGFVLDGKGPELSWRVLRAMAAGAPAAPAKESSAFETVLAVLLLVAAGAAGWYTIFKIVSGLAGLESGFQYGPGDGFPF